MLVMLLLRPIALVLLLGGISSTAATTVDFPDLPKYNVSASCQRGCFLGVRPDGDKLVAQWEPMGSDKSWTLLSSYAVFMMQLGFAMLEVGCCRGEHIKTVLAKNILDTSISFLGFLLHIALFDPALIRGVTDLPHYEVVLFHAVFCGTSTTICSGCMAERTYLLAYALLSFLMSFFIYPAIAGAVWAEGPYGNQSILHGLLHDILSLTQAPHDLAGSGVVHLTGGVAGFWGVWFLGPRLWRPIPREGSRVRDLNGQERRRAKEAFQSYKKYGWLKRFDVQRRRKDIQGTESPEQDTLDRMQDMEECEFRPFNPYMIAMGMFILGYGWFSFNSASVGVLDNKGAVLAPVAAWNTACAAAASCLSATLGGILMSDQFDIGVVANCFLSGLVAITACCDVATPGQSVVVGLFACVVYWGSSRAMNKLGLDDPVDAVPVHGANGLLGVIAAALCQPDCDYFERLGFPGHGFCAEDYDMLAQLGSNVWLCVVIVLFTSICVVLLFSIFTLVEFVYDVGLQNGLVEAIEAVDATLPDELGGTLVDGRGTRGDIGTAVQSFTKWLDELLRTHPKSLVVQALEQWKTREGRSAWNFDQIDQLVERVNMREALILGLNKEQSALSRTGCLYKIATLLADACCCRRCITIVRMRSAPQRELAGDTGFLSGGGEPWEACLGHAADAHRRRQDHQKRQREAAVAYVMRERPGGSSTHSGSHSAGIVPHEPRRRTDYAELHYATPRGPVARDEEAAMGTARHVASADEEEAAPLHRSDRGGRLPPAHTDPLHASPRPHSARDGGADRRSASGGSSAASDAPSGEGASRLAGHGRDAARDDEGHGDRATPLQPRSGAGATRRPAPSAGHRQVEEIEGVSAKAPSWAGRQSGHQHGRPRPEDDGTTGSTAAGGSADEEQRTF